MGNEGGQGLASADVRLWIRQTKTGWIRIWAPWWLIEPTAGNRGGAALAAIDNEIAIANAWELNVVLVSYGFAPWVAKAATVGADNPSNRADYFHLPASLSTTSDWANWIAFLYDRYKPGGSGPGTIKALEVANEPNLMMWPQQAANGDVSIGTATASMIRTAASIASARGGAVKILAPGSAEVTAGSSRGSTNLGTLIDKTLTALGSPTFTGHELVAWSHHNYRDVKNGEDNLATVVNRLAAWGWQGSSDQPGSLGIWITEGGYDIGAANNDSPSQGPALQANWNKLFSTSGSGAHASAIAQYLFMGESGGATPKNSGIRSFPPGASERTGWAVWRDTDAFAGLPGFMAGSPTLTTWGPGRLDLFVRGGNDNHLYHAAYVNGWTPWEDLTPSTGAVLASNPAAVAWSNGRIDLFYVHTNGQLAHVAYANNQWYPYDLLGGACTSSPAVSSWGPGRLDVFVRGANNRLFWRTYDNQWLNWQDLGGTYGGAPAVASWAAGRLDVFLQRADRSIWHRAYINGTFYPEDSMAGVSTGDLAATSWGSGRLDLFARGDDYALYHRVYDNSQWYPWERLGGYIMGGSGGTCWGVNRIDMAVARADGSIGIKTWQGSAWVP
ncbi:MAG TPA: hypothetical protein VFY45_04250 [Baekduia sp.]|nr:hypothetical protein [Baekduia sp.]